MTKAEMIAKIAEKTGESKKNTEATVNELVAVITAALKAGDKLQIAGLGTFESTERAAREVRNPRTGEKMTSPACKVVKFKAAKAIKDAVNG